MELRPPWSLDEPCSQSADMKQDTLKGTQGSTKQPRRPLSHTGGQLDPLGSVLLCVSCSVLLANSDYQLWLEHFLHYSLNLHLKKYQLPLQCYISNVYDRFLNMC